MDKCTGEGSDFNERGVCKGKCDGARPHKIITGEKVCVDTCEGDGYEYNDNGICTGTCVSEVYETRGG